MDLILKYLSVYFSSAVRFFVGPTLGTGYQIGILPTIILTILGMMTTIYLFTFFGHQIHRFMLRWVFRKQRKRFTPRNRKFVRVWKAYGLKGVAFITPIILSPVLGALLCNIVGGDHKEIIKWMWVSAVFWAIVETLVLYFAGELIFSYLD